MKSRYLPELSWADVREYLDRGGDMVLIPAGSTENHGPHAPLGTDSLVAEELSRRLAGRLDALAAPVLPLGFAHNHLPFPGSISLKNETLAQVLLETALCLAGQGFRRFVFLSGHGGNRLALDLACTNLKIAHPGVDVVHANILAVQTSRKIREQVESAHGTKLSRIWEAHAGEQEASAILAIRPELVNLDRAAPEPNVDAFLARVRDSEVYAVDLDLISKAPAGNWGDPSGATARQGELFLQAMEEQLAAKIIERFSL